MRSGLPFSVPSSSIGSLFAFYLLAWAFPLGPVGALFDHHPGIHSELWELAFLALLTYLVAFSLASWLRASWSPARRLTVSTGMVVVVLATTFLWGSAGRAYGGLGFHASRVPLAAPSRLAGWAAMASTRWVRRQHYLAHIDDPDPELRQIVADAVNDMTREGSDDYVRFPSEALQVALAPGIALEDRRREHYLETLYHWRSASPRVHAAVARALGSPVAGVRADAVTLLQDLGASEPETLAELRTRLADEDPGVRIRAARALLASDPENRTLKAELERFLPSGDDAAAP